MKKKILDHLVVGAGLSGLIFAKEYLKKKRKINILSGEVNIKNYKNKINFKFKNILPPQFKKKIDSIKNYFFLNQIKFDEKKCNILGTLEFGGISNYWGLQIDKNIDNEIQNLSLKTQKEIKNSFVDLLKENNLMGNYKSYKNNYILSDFFEKFLNNKKKENFFQLDKPILAISNKFSNSYLSKINNNKITKLTPNNIKKKISNRMVLYDFAVKFLRKKGKLIYVYCDDGKKTRVLITKKLILACGTIATTKLILDYLNVKKAILIKHHSRLTTMYVSKKKLISSLEFTPGIIQIRNLKYKFTSDLRPSNNQIINNAIKAYPFLNFLKPILLMFKDNLLFSNTLLSSKYSNLFIKKKNNFYYIYSMKKNILNTLKSCQKKIFHFLKFKKIVLPFYKNYFSGIGSDYHYFGTIPINSKGILSVNESCQLKNNKSIYIIDGSVFNFKNNFFPCGLMLANAKRIAKKLA